MLLAARIRGLLVISILSGASRNLLLIVTGGDKYFRPVGLGLNKVFWARGESGLLSVSFERLSI